MRPWRRVAGLVLVALAVLACRRAATEPDASEAQVPTTPTQADAAAARRWTVAGLEVVLAVAEDQQLPGLNDKSVTGKLSEAIAALPHVEMKAGAAPGDPVGLHLTLGWQAFDVAGRAAPIRAPTGGGSFLISATAHAERLGAKPRDIAERTVEASVPLPAERMGDIEKFVGDRMRQAAVLAVTDALGELWARRLTDAEVLGLLGEGPLWQQTAGAREAGERGLKDAREKLERAARDSRKDLASVAAAALGRLGDGRSVATLQALLDSPHLEVVDAALGALSDIGDAQALAALKDAAESHEVAGVRARASALLRDR